MSFQGCCVENNIQLKIVCGIPNEDNSNYINYVTDFHCLFVKMSMAAISCLCNGA